MASKKSEVKTIFEADTEQFTKAINKCKSETTSFKERLKLVDSELKGNSSSTELLTNKQTLLETQYNNLNKQVKLQEDYLKTANKYYGEDSKQVEILTNNLTRSKTARQNVLNQLSETKIKLNTVNEENSKYSKGILTCNNKLGELNKQLVKNQSEYGNTENKISNLKERQGILNKQLQVTQEKIDLNVEALVSFGEVTEENKDKYDKLSDSLVDSQIEYQKIQSQLTKTNNTLKEQTSVLSKVSKEFKTFGETCSKASRTLMPLSLVSGGVLVGVTKAAIDFQDAFAGVSKTVDATDDELGQISQELKDLSKVIPITTTELSETAETAGQLGIKAKDITTFTKVMAELGTATNLSATQAGEAIATFSNVMGTAADGYERIGSVVVKLGNNSKATESSILSMAERMMGAAATLGMTEADVLGLATALSSVGLEAEMGGTAISRVMNDFNRAASGVETKYGTLSQYAKICGMSTKEFAKTVKEDAGKAIELFIIGMANANDTSKGTIGLLEELGVSEVRLTDTLLRMANASGIVSEYVEMANKEWEENTALTTEATKKYQTVASKIQILKNRFNNLAINLGDLLLPYVEDLLEDAEKLIDWFSGLDEGTQKLILKTLTFTTVLGPFLGTIGKASTAVADIASKVKKFGDTAITLTSAVGGASGGISTMTTTVAALINPTTAAIALGTAAVVTIGVVASKLIENATALQKETDAIKEETKTMMENQSAKESSLKSSVHQLDYYTAIFDELVLLNDKSNELQKNKQELSADEKARMKEIVDILNEEYNLNLKVVNGKVDGLKQSKQALEEYIAQKKAQLILESQEESYMENQEKYNAKLAELNEVRLKLQGELNEKERKQYQEQYDELLQQTENFHTNMMLYEYNYEQYQQGHYTNLVTSQDEYYERVTEHVKKINVLNDESNKKIVESNKMTAQEVARIEAEKLVNAYSTQKEKEEILKGELKELESHLQMLEDLESQHAGIQYEQEIKTAKQSVENKKNEMKEVRDAISSSKDSIVEAYATLYGEQLLFMSGQTYKFKDLGNGQAQVYIDGFAATQPMAISKLGEYITSQIDTLNKKNQLFLNQGNTFGRMTIDGYKNYLESPETEGSLKAATNSLLYNGIKNPFIQELEIHSPSRYMKRIGGYVVDGLNAGLTDKNKTSTLSRAASSLANGIISKFKSILKINSPSKVTTEFGSFLDEGLIVGINREKSNVLKSVDNLSNDVVTHMNKGLNSELNNRIGLNSTINREISSKLNVSSISDMLSSKESNESALLERMNKLIELNEKLLSKDNDMYVDGKKVSQQLARPNNVEAGELFELTSKGVAT